MRSFKQIIKVICFAFLFGGNCIDGQNVALPTKCPITDGSNFLFRLTAATTSVTIENSAGLCTLSAVAPDGSYIPVGRSYDAKNWEAAGSMFAMEQVKSWTCNGGAFCTVALPGPNQYVLQRRPTSTVDSSSAAVRFLERASFGAMPGQARGSLNFATYIRDQIGIVPTYHREFFRKRMNPRWDYHQPEFASVVSPCGTANTYWRRHIVSAKDRRKSVRANVVNGTFWSVSVDGHVRSVKKDLRFNRTDRVLFDQFDHGVCSTVNKIRRGEVQLRVTGGQCVDVLANDWVVGFETSARPSQVLAQDLPAFNTTAWRSISKGVQFMLTTTLPNSSCASISSTAFGAVDGPPIFAKTSDGIWLIYEPRVILAENTIDRPLADGGLAALANVTTRYCSNAPRTFHNEAGCRYAAQAVCTTNNPMVVSGGVVCGSRGEVANDPTLGDNWLDLSSIAADRNVALKLPGDTTSIADFNRQRKYVWSEIALKSPDQLRQRVAWALFQIFALPKVSVAASNRLTEPFMAYYDVFVHHAFGNYRDILREMSYNPLMAESLSFLKSRSLAQGFDGQNLIYPDENYARELMQLFTIGLVQMTMDGTVKKQNGLDLRTYDSDNIVAFASIWTGMNASAKRANQENHKVANELDPIDVTASSRDRFPKHDLYGGFIGDKHPLCEDLPSKMHLRKGAKYRLLGSNPSPELVVDSASWVTAPSTKRLALEAGSALYGLLCQGIAGACSFPGVVILNSTITCSIGPECDVDTVRVVRVGNTGVYYEYVPNVPCVELSFFDKAVKVVGERRFSDPLCANRNLPVASEACCDLNSVTATPFCSYAGERMTLSTAQARCAKMSKQVCNYDVFNRTAACPHVGHHWTSINCTVEAKIDNRGFVAVVHKTADARTPSPFVRDNSPSFFKVQWGNATFPIAPNCLPGCRTTADGSCICPISVETQAVFSSPPPDSKTIHDALHIGHANPSLYNNGTFQSRSTNGYKFYSADGSCCNINTVFELTDDRTGQVFFLKNTLSKVKVAGTLEFRNAPHFNKIIPSEYSKTDAYHEVEALLDHLFYHPNTAPFVAYRFIQKFGFSNPSPRYVEAVATAFQRGVYQSFGTGKYGDLQATVAAVLMDQEAVTPLLDNDPSAGSLREPILKVLAFMRALQFKSSTPLLELDEMEKKIGQAPWEQPSVFNFYRSEYSPPGRASSSALTAPEVETMSSGNIIGLLNGLVSQALDGLVNCGVGFAQFPETGCVPGYNSGELEYAPANVTDRNGVLEHLTVLLTAGRLSSVSKSQILTEMQAVADPKQATKRAIQYIATTPEFHTTNKLDLLPPPIRDGGVAGVPISNPGYKAVIHLALRGGLDSYHMIAPHTSCDIYANYQSVRGVLALPGAKMSSIAASGQPCGTFGLHSSLPYLKTLYDLGDLAFLANTGVLSAPATKSNYNDVTLSALFAHNKQQDEVDTLDSGNKMVGTGTLGRMADSLQRQGYKTARVTVDAAPSNLAGRLMKESPIISLDRNGVKVFDPKFGMNKTAILSLNGNPATRGVYGDTWSSMLMNSMDQSESLAGIFTNRTLATSFDQTSSLSSNFQVIAEMIAKRVERNVTRDHFFVTFDGFDMHKEVPETITAKFTELDKAMRELTTVLQSLGVWGDVVLVQTSDFGRTLTPNSGGGSDHGWAGNSFIAGGKVKGGRFFGTYPNQFDDDGPLSIGRGRLIPTLSWDAVMNGIAEWMGVAGTALNTVLPSRNNFKNLLTAMDLFE